MRIMASPWRRAPVALLKRPGVALSLVAATFVAVLPAAAAPLFLGTAESATFQTQINAGCVTSAGVSMVGYLNNSTDESLRTELVAVPLAAGSVPNLQTPRPTLIAQRLYASGVPVKPDSQWPITIIARPDFKRHIQVLAQAPSTLPNGLWIPDDLAAVWKVKPGDAFHTHLYQTTTVMVQGIYRSMATGHLDPAWCSVKSLVQTPELSDGVPPVLLGDFDTVMTVEFSMGQAPQVRFESGLIDPAPTPELARSMAAGLHAAEPAIHAADTGDVGAQPMTITSPLRRFLDRAGLVGRTLQTPIYAVSAAGAAVGLLVLGAATVLWTRRREHELAVLAVRGSAPLALGFKGLLEALPALVVGAVLGAVAARSLISAVGPAGQLSGDAWRLGLKLSGVVLAIAALVVVVVATRRCRKLTDTTPHLHTRSRLAAVPWEILLFAAAWVAWDRMTGELTHTDGPLAVGGAVVSLPPRTLVIPIMLIVAASILASRLAACGSGGAAARRPSRSHARYLARRRPGPGTGRRGAAPGDRRDSGLRRRIRRARRRIGADHRRRQGSRRQRHRHRGDGTGTSRGAGGGLGRIGPSTTCCGSTARASPESRRRSW